MGTPELIRSTMAPSVVSGSSSRTSSVQVVPTEQHHTAVSTGAGAIVADLGAAGRFVWSVTTPRTGGGDVSADDPAALCTAREIIIDRPYQAVGVLGAMGIIPDQGCSYGSEGRYYASSTAAFIRSI
jgi:hypothetical protein